MKKENYVVDEKYPLGRIRELISMGTIKRSVIYKEFNANNSNSKKAIDKQLARVCDFQTKGHSFIIKEIYKVDLPYVHMNTVVMKGNQYKTGKTKYCSSDEFVNLMFDLFEGYLVSLEYIAYRCDMTMYELGSLYNYEKIPRDIIDILKAIYEEEKLLRGGLSPKEYRETIGGKQ